MNPAASLPSIAIEPPRILATEVAAALEWEVIFGDLPANTRLTEEIVCQRTGVSRSPVREAMRMLEQDGLLVREPRRGVRVAPLSAEDAEEVYTCRVPIETLAAGLAARHAKSSDIAEMRRLHKLCASRFAEGDVRGHFRANAQMSDVLYRSARNQTLLRLEQVIKKQALRYRFLVYCRSETFRWDSVRSNAALIDAIANKDSTAAERLVHNLITSSLPAIKTCLVE